MSTKQILKNVVNNIVLRKLGLKIYSTQAFGRELCGDIRNIIESPNVMLDVGANVGQTIELWKHEFPNPKIHSFEPVKRLFTQLSDKHQHHAICNNLGVGSKCETIQIHYGKHDVSHSFVSDGVERGGEEAEVVTLDKYCDDKDIDRVSVLKIDVEGFEVEVINGASKLLTEQRVDLVSVELGVDPDGYYVFYPDFAKKISQFGYSTVGFYDQTCDWDGTARLLFCNVLFARKGLKFAHAPN